MLAACVVLLLLVAATVVFKRFEKRAVHLITFIAVHVSGLAALLLVFTDVTQAVPAMLAAALECVVGIAAALLSFLLDEEAERHIGPGSGGCGLLRPGGVRVCHVCAQFLPARSGAWGGVFVRL